MKHAIGVLKVLLMSAVLVSLSGCDDPQVYGSVGVSSGYSNYNNYGRRGHGAPGVRTSVSVGGRIR